MGYRVGQVLYVVLRKEPNVYPMQIVEEITKKTLDGEVTSYMLRAGADPQKVLPINDIDGEIFDSAETAKRTLIERVSQSIAHRVDQAISKAREWYPSGFESPSDDPMSLIKKTLTVSEQHVSKSSRTNVVKPEVAQLAAEFAAEVDDGTMMELPDGTKAKIKSVKLPPSMQG